MRTRFRNVACLLAVLFCLSGCLKLDLTLEEGGGGKFTLVHPASNLDEVKRRASSPSVTLEDASLKGNTATVRAKFTDVTKISSAEMFKDVVITVDTAGGQSNFIARLNNSFAKKTPESVLKSIVDRSEKEAVITVTFPGEVTETNATKKQGKVATWVVPTRDIVYSPLIRFEAKYKKR